MIKTKIVGHKGAAGYAPENTLTSFQKAIDVGCDRAELDVRLTKDNQVVVFHDKEVSALTDGEGFVNEMTLDEIKKLNCGDGEKIPTLQEVVDLCKDKIDLQIELKAEGTPELVNEIVVKNEIEDQVVITSFKENFLKEIKSLNPDLKVGLLFYTNEAMLKIWELTEEIPLDFFAPHSEMVTKEFIEKAHDIGKTVYAYRVNEKDLGDKLISMGVDSIGTDFPKLFISRYND
ncbi:MAG: glycerophosphodiester phosphodiesterase family protein [Candidatus Moranbacteria bacterium]|nr:glycerophosphodiester phosphodiesterase family protein [Candidatus Moranbacteria bacterium]